MKKSQMGPHKITTYCTMRSAFKAEPLTCDSMLLPKEKAIGKVMYHPRLTENKSEKATVQTIIILIVVVAPYIVIPSKPTTPNPLWQTTRGTAKNST